MTDSLPPPFRILMSRNYSKGMRAFLEVIMTDEEFQKYITALANKPKSNEEVLRSILAVLLIMEYNFKELIIHLNKEGPPKWPSAGVFASPVKGQVAK